MDALGGVALRALVSPEDTRGSILGGWFPRFRSPMDTPPPLAARFFYAIATVLLFAGVAVLLIAFFGTRWVLEQNWPALEALLGIAGVINGILLLLGAGCCGALAAVIHDIRRIAVNTAAESLPTSEFETDRPVRPTRKAAPHVNAAYYYVQDGTEHGPVNHSRMARLLRTRGEDAFSRIERETDGVREAVDPREFG